MAPPKDPIKYAVWKAKQDLTRPRGFPRFTVEQELRRRTSLSKSKTGTKNSKPLATKGKTLEEIHGLEKARKITENNRLKHIGRSSGMKGKNSWNKGLWISESRGSAKDLNWIASVLKRDSYTCKICGKTESTSIAETGKGLHAHHVKNWNDYPDFRFDLDNGLTVCYNCHPKLEGKRWYNNGEEEKMLCPEVVEATFILGRIHKRGT